MQMRVVFKRLFSQNFICNPKLTFQIHKQPLKTIPDYIFDQGGLYYWEQGVKIRIHKKCKVSSQFLCRCLSFSFRQPFFSRVSLLFLPFVKLITKGSLFSSAVMSIKPARLKRGNQKKLKPFSLISSLSQTLSSVFLHLRPQYSLHFA